MTSSKGKILILVEGEKTDLQLISHLLKVYGLKENHQIVSYNTNIYTLYNEMFRDNDPYSNDILQVLKSREKDQEKKKIFNERYSDILLIFDLDPHAPDFSQDKINEMTAYFTESSDMGKLYLNYPMVESFYHMESIPDDKFNEYVATMDELIEKKYKTRVSSLNRNKDYRKFAIDKLECDVVIKQNIEKAWLISGYEQNENQLPDSNEILNKQLEKMTAENSVFVLCTCCFYIVDYNPNLIGHTNK